jgi:hypothetical protein
MKAYRRLTDAQQGHRLLMSLWADMKPWLIAGHRLEIEVRPERRNDSQNALLHALLGDISARLEWGGRKWDIEDWKRLLTAAWMRTQRQQAVMVPALDGQGFEVLYRRTSTLSKAECAELIDFIQAWAAQQGLHVEQELPT